jgi:hypothetical protein
MAEEMQSIVPVRQQAVEFYGDQVLAAQLADGTIWVPLRPLCDALGVAWAAQRVRLNRDPVLAGEQGVIVTITPGGPQEMVALPLKLLPGFLFGLQASRVKPELREKIIRYQRDCYEALWNAFKADILPGATASPADLSGAEQALVLAEAVAGLAREHLALERRQTVMADYLRGYIQQTARTLDDHDTRLQALELRLGGAATISEAEAGEIALAVKNVAKLLEGRGITNPYQQVWGDLYRRFRVAAYRNLPAARYAEVLAWLSGWYQELSGEG